MEKLHRIYLSLGSNIDPEINLARAIPELRKHGEIRAISGVWQSHAVGTGGPDFLNLCLDYRTPLDATTLRREALRPIERVLGRSKPGDKNAPRTIDIDVIMIDNNPVNMDRWSHAYVLLPLAELLPDFVHPLDDVPLADAAKRVQAVTWIRRHPLRLEPNGTPDGA